MSRQLMILGVDGGGSRGRMLAVDATGTVVARCETGPLNINNESATEIQASLAEGMRIVASGGTVAACCAGVAGIKDGEDARMFEDLLRGTDGLHAAAVRAVNDIVILQASALGEQSGIALILGTGSHCHGKNMAGESTTCGGWGYLMDDCGGGYAIGHAALRAAARMWDGRLPATALAGMVMEHLGITRPETSLRRVHNTDFGFDDIKALAPRITALAASGDSAALTILRAAAADAAALVDVVAKKLSLGEAPDVVITGGVATDTTFQPILREALCRTLPGVRMIVPDLPPVAGAVVLAAGMAGVTVDAAFLRCLRDSLSTSDNP